MKTFAPDLDDDEIDDRLHNHTYCPNGHSDSGGIPLFIILITLGQGKRAQNYVIITS